jgi:hypothetical protein
MMGLSQNLTGRMNEKKQLVPRIAAISKKNVFMNDFQTEGDGASGAQFYHLLLHYHQPISA